MKRIAWFISVFLGLSLLYPWATHLFNHWIQLHSAIPSEELTPAPPVSPAVSSHSMMVQDIPAEPAVEKPPMANSHKVPPQPRKDLTRPAMPPSTPTSPGLQQPPKPIHILEIPVLGIKRAIYEDASPANLRRGPSHMRESAAYGEPGICLIAGHRTTYGAPFRQVDRLVPGDVIRIHSPNGTYEYIVQDHLVVNANYKTDFQSDTQELYLSTCHPPHSAKQRLLIRCRLRQDF